MKIFISYSSRQRLFVQKIQERLPAPMRVWVDEKDLAVGEDLEVAIQAAIKEECDLFLVVIDDHGVQSKWVSKEIEWALEEEARRASGVYLLPVVVEESAWKNLDIEGLRNRKYLSCQDFSAQSLAAFTDRLLMTVVDWLCEERLRDETKPASVLSLVQEAENLQQDLATQIRTIVHPYRRSRPLSVHELARELVVSGQLPAGRESELPLLLERLRQSHLLEGLFWDGDIIYLTEERYYYKSGIYRDAKRRIAKLAVESVQQGYSIAVDGGSTTLEVARRIAKEVRAKALTEIEVFTNSLPAVNELLVTLNEMQAGDRDTLCRVTVPGGWCRPMSMTVVPNLEIRDRFVDLPEAFDVAFVGTNGLYREEGFAVKHQFEGPTKSELLKRSRRKVILADPSKFLVSQSEVFARFEDGVEVITASVAGMDYAIERMAELLEGSPSRLVVAP